MKKLTQIIGAVAVCLTLSVPQAHAVGMGYSQAEATGMAGAYSAFADGIHAPYWNPANLAARSGPNVEIGLFNLGVLVGNDGIGWSDYIGWVDDGVLTTSEVQSALDQFPGSSLSIHESLEFGAPFSMAIGRWAFSWSFVQMVEIGLARGFVDMITDDPLADVDVNDVAARDQAILDRYNDAEAGNIVRDLSGMKADVWAMSTLGISHGRLIDVPMFERFAVGGSFNVYLAGPRMRIVRSEGEAVVRGNTWDADALVQMELSGAEITTTEDSVWQSDYFGGGGHWEQNSEREFSVDQPVAWGLGVNIGAAGTWQDEIDFSVAIMNLPIRMITWTTGERRTFHIQNDTDVNAKSMFDDKPDGQDMLDYLDTLWAPSGAGVASHERLSSTTAAPPTYVRAGAAKDFFGPLLTWTVDIEQAFAETAITSTTPRLSTGAEVRPLGKWVPIRAGMSVGGRTGHFASLGFGIHIPGFQFDTAFVKEGAFTPFEVPFSGASTGVGFAAEMKISL